MTPMHFIAGFIVGLLTGLLLKGGSHAKCGLLKTTLLVIITTPLAALLFTLISELVFLEPRGAAWISTATAAFFTANITALRSNI